jgi:hypothetical protein
MLQCLLCLAVLLPGQPALPPDPPRDSKPPRAGAKPVTLTLAPEPELPPLPPRPAIALGFQPEPDPPGWPAPTQAVPLPPLPPRPGVTLTLETDPAPARPGVVLSTTPLPAMLPEPELPRPSRPAITLTMAAEPAPPAVPPATVVVPEKPVTAMVLPPPPPPAAAPTPAAAAAAPPPRYLFMDSVQGSWLGTGLDTNRITISGWTEMSFTASSAQYSNQPVVWNDRANQFLLQQHWLRFDRPVVTSGTTEPTWGFRSDWLFGSDYRFTLPRGLWNSQLLNSRQVLSGPGANFQDTQNLYGVDPIQFYVNAYFPTLFQGTEVRIGRLFTPWGAESLEAVSTPLLSRSYAFNWSPPFTNSGIMAIMNLNPKWKLTLMLANGNDVWIGNPAEELRSLGNLTWTSADKKDVVALAWSLGRGKFNAGAPFAPATIGLMAENAGRNNLNAFDLLWTHAFNPRLSYTLEAIYGYQYGVPSTLAFGGMPTSGAIINDTAFSGTAHWASICQYLTYVFDPELSGIARFETFDDFEGQRTGYEGLYTALTMGLQYRPKLYGALANAVIIRPELRYDHYWGNTGNGPFDPDQTNTGRSHDIFTAGTDFILRW